MGRRLSIHLDGQLLWSQGCEEVRVCCVECMWCVHVDVCARYSCVTMERGRAVHGRTIHDGGECTFQEPSSLV